MKAKHFLLFVCLITGIALSDVSAQNNVNAGNTKSVQYWAELGYYTPVYCGDDMVDYLQGVVRYHVIDNYKDGAWKWEIAQAKGEATGIYGEVFQITETDKYWLPVYGLLVWHFNARGDRGHHYIGTLTYSYLDGSMVIGKTVCK